MKILVTGGAGYIGTHACVELVRVGYELVVLDNLCNAKEESIRRIEKILGQKIPFHKVDLLDVAAVKKVFLDHRFDAVMHFAGLKAVGESVSLPGRYYHNNLTGTLILCEQMKAAGVKRMVFSSSATVYGNPQRVPIVETDSLGPTNPYGRTKWFIEMMLEDLCHSDPGWTVTLLRYFNPIGAHESGLIGEDPNGIPNNLMPYVAQVAVGKLEKVAVFGNDYPTPDGTGVRDYIHVVDLVKGHICALERLKEQSGARAYNLGTGKGNSVLEMIRAFETASGKKIPYAIAPRRPGDIAACYADVDRAEKELKWKADWGIERGCEDMWRWQEKNPRGYG